jgi:DNA-binding HxlR family transcriptional regulator
MPATSHSKTTCATTLKLLGDFWTLSIIDTLRHGELRYCELQRQLGMVNPVTLSNRLQALEKENILTRTTDPSDKVAVLYALSSRGKEALKVVDALNAFSKK